MSFIYASENLESKFSGVRENNIDSKEYWLGFAQTISTFWFNFSFNFYQTLKCGSKLGNSFSFIFYNIYTLQITSRDYLIHLTSYFWYATLSYILHLTMSFFILHVHCILLYLATSYYILPYLYRTISYLNLIIPYCILLKSYYIYYILLYLYLSTPYYHFLLYVFYYIFLYLISCCILSYILYLTSRNLDLPERIFWSKTI